MKYAFIAIELLLFPISVLCHVMSVTQSGYHAWAKRLPSKTEQERERLSIDIRRIYDAHKGRYGAPRIYKTMCAHYGYTGNLSRIQKLMKALGLAAKGGVKFKVTTDSDHDGPIAPNLLMQDFSCDPNPTSSSHAKAPNRVWLSDITYIWTREGWLFVAAVLDLFTRKIIGWGMGERITRHIVLDALDMAKLDQKLNAKLIFHSDRGSQYASKDVRDWLKDNDMRPSMSSTGNCFDNAPMESFWHSLKVEATHGEDFATRDDAKACVFDYIEGYYNTVRMHSSIGYMSPTQFERRLAA